MITRKRVLRSIDLDEAESMLIESLSYKADKSVDDILHDIYRMGVAEVKKNMEFKESSPPSLSTGDDYNPCDGCSDDCDGCEYYEQDEYLVDTGKDDK